MDDEGFEIVILTDEHAATAARERHS